MNDTHNNSGEDLGYDPARLSVPEVIAAIDRREPVIGPDSIGDFKHGNVERGWTAATEIVRRLIPGSEELRRELQGFIDAPITEQTPREFVDAVDENLIAREETEDEETNKNVSRWSAALGRVREFVQLPSVPDSAIQPDITSAPSLLSPEYVAHNRDDSLMRGYFEYGNDKPTVNEMVLLEQDRYINGLSLDERDLIEARYRYARDVKLLALMAELTERPIKQEDIQQNGGIYEIDLPSGVNAVFDAEIDSGSLESLINPGNWEKRRQIKDRVYEVTIDGSRYILKERKTDRHRHTKEKGHSPGNTSRREFEVAQQMHNEFQVEEDDISLVWEKPLAAVTYPDGFQFVLFEFDDVLEGIEPNSDMEFAAQHRLANAIYGSPYYDEEYKDFKEKAEEWLRNSERIEELTGFTVVERTGAPTAEHSAPEESSRGWFRKWLQTRRSQHDNDEVAVGTVAGNEQVVQPEDNEVTRVDYARLKAMRITDRLRRLHQKTMFDAGMYNYDLDGYKNVVKVDDRGRAYLERHIFDLEYQFTEDPDRNAGLRRDYETQHWPNDDKRFLRSNFDETPTVRAARFALFEVEGGTVPSSLDHEWE